MTCCTKCGQSAVGTHNGQPYCHRKACIDWKLVRLERGVK